MVFIKTVAAVLFAVNWLYLSSSSKDYCLRNLDGGQGNLYLYILPSLVPRPFSPHREGPGDEATYYHTLSKIMIILSDILHQLFILQI